MTCKDCPHFDVCKMYGAFHTKRRIYNKWKNCPFRNDKAKYIELPCTVINMLTKQSLKEKDNWYMR